VQKNSQPSQPSNSIIDQFLINKLKPEQVIKLKAVELSVAFSLGKDMTPDGFNQVYEECFNFLNNNNE
jgi:hypothetical protein